MIRLILDDEQVRSLSAHGEAIEICDRSGKLLGYLAKPPSDDEIAAAKERLKSDGPWYTTQEVLDHLGSLE